MMSATHFFVVCLPSLCDSFVNGNKFAIILPSISLQWTLLLGRDRKSFPAASPVTLDQTHTHLNKAAITMTQHLTRLHLLVSQSDVTAYFWSERLSTLSSSILQTKLMWGTCFKAPILRVFTVRRAWMHYYTLKQYRNVSLHNKLHYLEIPVWCPVKMLSSHEMNTSVILEK